MTFKNWLPIVVHILFSVFWAAVILDTRRSLNLYLLTAISFKSLLRWLPNNQLGGSLVNHTSHGRMLRRFQSTDLLQVNWSFPVGVTSLTILNGPFCLENWLTTVHTLLLSGRKCSLIRRQWLISSLLSLIYILVLNFGARIILNLGMVSLSYNGCASVKRLIWLFLVHRSG